MARKPKKTARRNRAPAIPEASRLAEVELSDADKAVLEEVNLNRRAIVAMGKIALDHERRLGNLEGALAELAGVDGADMIELVEAEEVGEEEGQTSRKRRKRKSKPIPGVS
jgi:hypothetical protein